MEKRFALFLVCSSFVIVGHILVQTWLAPRKPPAAEMADADGGAGAEEGPDIGERPDDDAPDGVAAQDPGDDAATPDGSDTAIPPEESTDQPPKPEEAQPDDQQPGQAPELSAGRSDVAHELLTLGSMAADSPYRMLVTLDNRGAAVRRIELTAQELSGRFRYRDLYRRYGYLGHLGLQDEPDSHGCRVRVVGSGTPAAAAQPKEPSVPVGLRVDDVIRRAGDRDITGALDLEDLLLTTEPGQSLELGVTRTTNDGVESTLGFTVQLIREPLSVIRPEPNPNLDLIGPDSNLIGYDPASFLMTLESLGSESVERGREEFSDLPSLRDGLWQIRRLPDEGAGPGIEFVFPLSEAELKAVGAEGSLEIVKRYLLAPTPEADLDNAIFPSYHLLFEIEIRNTGKQRQQLAYRLDGPNGLPTEGWWYSNKIHPEWFASAGSRDIVWSSPTAGHRLVGASSIYKDAKEAEEKDQSTSEPLFSDTKPQSIDYVGVDTQYFTVVMQPEAGDNSADPSFQKGLTLPAGPVGEKKKTRIKTTNVTYRLISSTKSLAPGEVHRERFEIFAGPKDLALLREYGLEDCIEFGWFKWISILLSSLLHLFAAIPLVNYGLAIVLLTVLVRSCMTPLSRKAAKNAQMMQQLAPEMKALAEKHKNDMEKRGTAQRELFAKHNYNPFGGCLMMFVQLPIFIGLYRALSVDIELRDAALIPGIRWCSNLAGPDMLWFWKPLLPAMLADETGWLGPYLNVLPLVTVVLFLVQQKLFMPPATDDQTRMQQQMMKFMMLFMGVLFFRVPSGLCIYFIASSLWGIAERKLLPPVGKTPVATEKPPSPSDGGQKKSSSNGGLKKMGKAIAQLGKPDSAQKSQQKRRPRGKKR